jgi:tellurite resistance protein
MPDDKFIRAAARAHAMICLADGRVSPLEARAFVATAQADPAFASYADAELKDVATRAFGALSGDESFDDIAGEIAAFVKAPAEREAILRIARAALVADSVRREQEDDALRALAAALGMDPATA